MTKKEQFANMTPEQKAAWNRGYRKLRKGQRQIDHLDTRLHRGEIAFTTLPTVTYWRQVRNDSRKLIWVSHTTENGVVCDFDIPSGSRILLAGGLSPDGLPHTVYGEIVAGKNGIRIHAWPLRQVVRNESEAWRPIMPPVTLPIEFSQYFDSKYAEELMTECMGQ